MSASQVQVLNRILADHSYGLVEANNLNKEYFPDFESEFIFIKNHHAKYGCVPDQLTFAESFPEFPFTDVKEPTNYILEKLFEEHETVYLATTFNKIRELIENGDGAAASAYFKNAFDNRPNNSVSTSIDLIEEAQNRLADYNDKMINRAKQFINFGFPELDAVLGGIDRKNENLVIAARPGVGKSWLLLAFAVNAYKQGMRVGLYSGEMTKEKVGIRFDTLYGHINNSAIMHGRDHNGVDSRAYAKYIKDIREVRDAGQKCINTNNLPSVFKIITPNEINGSPTVNALAAFVDREKLDILFIDQYSLLEDDSGAYKENEKVANISKAVKNLQVRKQIPIVSVCQMNRQKNEDKSQDVSQLGLSDRIGQDATTVLMLDRESLQPIGEGETSNGKDKNILVIRIAKARDGGYGEFKYVVDFNRGNFTPLNDTYDNTQYEEDRYGDSAFTF